MAGLRLDAADGKHKAAGAIAPVGAQSHQAGNVKSANHFAGAADFDAIAQARAAQSVVHQNEPLLQGRAHMVDELQGRRAGAAFGTVHHNKVGRDAGVQHRFDYAKPLPRVAHAKLKTGGLTAREFAQARNKLHELERRAKGAVRRW